MTTLILSIAVIILVAVFRSPKRTQTPVKNTRSSKNKVIKEDTLLNDLEKMHRYTPYKANTKSPNYRTTSEQMKFRSKGFGF